MTFLWAAIEGRSPLDVWIAAVIIMAALAVTVLVVVRLLEGARYGSAISTQSISANPAGIESERTAPVPINDASLGAYMRSSQRVRHLDKLLAQSADLKVDDDRLTVAWPMEEQAHLLGISDVKQLDDLLEENEEIIVRLSHYSFIEKRPVAIGECVIYLFGFLSAKLGREKYKEFAALCSLMTGSSEGAYIGLEQITAYPISVRNKPVTDQLFAHDFNLLPIADAADILRRELGGTAIGENIRARATSNEDSILAYCSLLARIKVRSYGRKDGEQFRKRINIAPPLTFAMDHGAIIATTARAQYRDLFALKPDIGPAVKKNREAVALG
jgi:hypothetical protein